MVTHRALGLATLSKSDMDVGTGTDTHTKTHTDTHRHTHRHTDTHTHTHTHRHTHTHTRPHTIACSGIRLGREPAEMIADRVASLAKKNQVY